MIQILYYFVGIIIVCLFGYIIFKYCQKNNNQENTNYIQELNELDAVNSQIYQIPNQKQDLGQQNFSQISQKSGNRQMSSINSKIQLSAKQNTITSIFQPDQQRKMTVQKKINYIYDQSWRKRKVDENYKYFLGECFQFSDLCLEYKIKKLQIKQNLKQICQSYRAVRGDGNCFYTAFGFQFLQILVLKYTTDQFYKFLQQNEIPFQINLNTQNIINENTQQEFRNEFFFRLERLKLIQDVEIRKQRLYQEFRAYEQENDEIDGCFYGLATIFFRNLAYKSVELAKNIFDKQNLFLWEVECNENEVVISNLANFLKLFIQFIFFDKNEDFQVTKYGEENYDDQLDNKIILLFRPGHYTIGIKN